MSNYASDPRIESGLLFIANNFLDDVDIYLEKDEYYRLSFSIYDHSRMKNIISTFNFKDIGDSSRYSDVMPQETSFVGTAIYSNISKLNRICISEKYNAIMIYSVNRYSTEIFCLISKNKFKKFSKKMSHIVESQNSSGIFDSIDFSCKKKEFIEITSPLHEDDRYATVQKRKVDDENLVFETDSEIFKVMSDIKTFFTKESKELYKKMGILYKRGIIIYGDPGNGKTAMIREIIRQLPGITTIIINPNTPRVTFVLSELITALNGRKAIIVIEDIDAVLSNNNRSEFLNILDGVNVKSGIYFVGTTNYPERIDPAFINRSGRFDRSYKIDNPSNNTRRLFFRTSKIDSLLSSYKIYKDNSELKDMSIIDLFVKFSEGLSMANLKELMISVQYMLISNKSLSIEEVLETCVKNLKDIKEKHDASHTEYTNYRNNTRPYRRVDYDY